MPPANNVPVFKTALGIAVHPVQHYLEIHFHKLHFTSMSIKSDLVNIRLLFDTAPGWHHVTADLLTYN
jgi:hypothetical protein